MLRHRNYGLPISLVLHLIIFAIPMSMTVTRHFKEVELFVIDESQPVQKNQVPLQKPHLPKLKVRSSYEMPQEPVMEERLIEPVILSEEKEAVTVLPPVLLTPPIVEPVKEQPQQRVEAVKEESLRVPEEAPIKRSVELKDVEFGGDFGPKFLYREMPVYPFMARRLGKEGRVVLRLTIDEKGNLLNVEVIEGAGYGFTEAAIDAVKKSTFLPAKVDGKPIMSKALLTIRFSLRRD